MLQAIFGFCRKPGEVPTFYDSRFGKNNRARLPRQTAVVVPVDFEDGVTSLSSKFRMAWNSPEYPLCLASNVLRVRSDGNRF